MRLLSILIVGLLSFSTLANNVQTAQDLYAKRSLESDGIANAQKAADIYETLAAKAEGVEKVELLINQSEALYFVALITQFNGDKSAAKKIYWEGYEIGLAAANLLGDNPADEKDEVNPKNEEDTELLARAMYWEVVNCLRWGKLNGIFASLGKWNDIGKPRIKDMLRLNYEVMNFGAHRSVGKALLTLPGNQSVEDMNALEYLSEAYYETETTVGEYTLADNMATVTFYLEGLRKYKNKEEGCPIYNSLKGFMESATKTQMNEMFPNLIPEAKYEYKEFMNEKKNTKFYKKC